LASVPSKKSATSRASESVKDGKKLLFEFTARGDRLSIRLGKQVEKRLRKELHQDLKQWLRVWLKERAPK